MFRLLMTMTMTAAGVLALSWPLSARAGLINVFGDTADARVEDDSGDDSTRDGLGSNIDSATSATSRVGSFATDRNIALVFPFALPAIDPLDITAASISFRLDSLNGTPTFNAILSALNRTNASPTVQVTDFEGAGIDLDTQFLTPTSTTAQFHTYSGPALTTFLQTQYATANPGDFVFFRLKPSNNAGNYADSLAYTVNLADSSGTSQDPVLSITTIPEPTSMVGLVMAGFGLFARRRQRSR